MSLHGLIHPLFHGGLDHAFHNVHNGRNVPEGMNWPKSARSQNQPRVSCCVKFAPVDEYSGLSMMVQCGSADATRMGLVECVLSAPTHPSLRLLVNPLEKPVVIQFILPYTKTEDECFKMYTNTTLMVQKILDGFDVDPCRCFGVK